MLLRYSPFNKGNAKRYLSAAASSSEPLNRLLDTHNRGTRNSLRQLFKKSIFTPRYNISLSEERQLAYDRLSTVCRQNLVSVRDFETNPKNIFAAHEILGMCDGSLCTKFTVQFNLFGGTLFKLGTKKHHHLCDSIDNFSQVGCFGLTELGYGNNAVEMETTAHYDNETQEFVINTPSTKAQKYWITNGALHAHSCIVFAKLIMPDGHNQGLHGFLVPIRDENLNIRDNVKIWDLGYKIGLNGIDNAALWFDNVRIPEDNLLNATSQVRHMDGKAVYTSMVPDSSKRKRKRFIVLADQLLSGRICISSMSLGSTKMVLAATIKYAHNRLAVGKEGFSDMPIMNYQLQRNALMPLIAKTYVYNFFLNYVQERYTNQTESDHDEVVRLCCIAKPLLTWHAENTATVCRERSGGQGFLSANRFGEALFGAHAGITAEGDNRVIQQKVSKELLALASKGEVLKFTIRSRSPRSLQILHSRLSNKFPSGSQEWFLGLFKLRERVLLNNLAYAIHKAGKRNLFSTWMLEQSDQIQQLANAYGQRLALQESVAVVKESKGVISEMLGRLLSVFAITEIKDDSGFFLSQGVISLKQYRKLEKELNLLNSQLAGHALDLTNGFGIPDWMHHEPIANDWEKYNTHENNGELEDQDYRR